MSTQQLNIRGHINRATPISAREPVRPVVRWAGSKSKLLNAILPFVPKAFDTYFEPFFGSGALFFNLQPDKACLGDMCQDLVDTYTALRDSPTHVIRHLSPLQLNESTYYAVRSEKPKSRYKAAARFLYLNKACWNGLYRVNLRGEFNVPYGRPKTQNVFDPTQLRAVSRVLSGEDIRMARVDFARTLSTAKKGDFVFLDPPYVTKHNLNGFAEWNETIFSWDDQIRLAATAVSLAKSGVNVLVTNANHKDVVALYPGFKHRQLKRHSTLAGDMSKRAVVSEAILFGGPYAR